jgi:mRNA-degrading endonuclease RelE of RelBE toxin-antitoxin system
MADEWTWELRGQKAIDDFDGLEPEAREQIVKKLDEICTSPWRDPPDYGEPLRNSPYKKIRIGQYRCSVSFDREAQQLSIHRIKPRSGAYTADD